MFHPGYKYRVLGLSTNVPKNVKPILSAVQLTKYPVSGTNGKFLLA
jgi:hypothetical protein